MSFVIVELEPAGATAEPYHCELTALTNYRAVVGVLGGADHLELSDDQELLVLGCDAIAEVENDGSFFIESALKDCTFSSVIVDRGTGLVASLGGTVGGLEALSSSPLVLDSSATVEFRTVDELIQMSQNGANAIQEQVCDTLPTRLGRLRCEEDVVAPHITEIENLRAVKEMLAEEGVEMK